MAVKNFKLYYQESPTSSLVSLSEMSTSGKTSGVICEAINNGIFVTQTPPVSVPDEKDVVSSNDGGANWIRQTLPALKTDLTGKLIAESSGGSGNNSGTFTNIMGGGVGSVPYQASPNHTTFAYSTPFAVLSTDSSGVPSFETTLTQDTTGNAATTTSTTNISAGVAGSIPYQTAANTTGFIAKASNSVMSNINIPPTPVWIDGLSTSNIGFDNTTVTDPTTSTSDTIKNSLSHIYTDNFSGNILGGFANSIPYQTSTNATGFVPVVNNAVFVTSSSGVPSESTTLPAVRSGATFVTDPTTSSIAPLDTALANVMTYSPLIYDTYIAISPNTPTIVYEDVTTRQYVGADITIPAGKYLLSFNVSIQYVSPGYADGAAIGTAFIYDTVNDVNLGLITPFVFQNLYFVATDPYWNGSSGSSIAFQTFTASTTLRLTVVFSAPIGRSGSYLGANGTIMALQIG